MYFCVYIYLLNMCTHSLCIYTHLGEKYICQITNNRIHHSLYEKFHSKDIFISKDKQGSFLYSSILILFSLK